MLRVIAPLALTLLVAALLPVASWSCNLGDRNACRRGIAVLVANRAEAINRTFGDLSPLLPENISVRFMSSGSPEHTRFSGEVGYDRDLDTLYFPHGVINDEAPQPLRRALDYWPFYQNKQLREAYPIVQQIDAALWNAYMQEAASRSGLSWPHTDCRSPDSSQRLPCEMLVAAASESVNRAQQRIFNANRVGMIWPEDYADFCARMWRSDDRSVSDVRLYGGLLLVRPLIRKFGVPHTLAYLAQTPFRVEANNMRLSAANYQERALQSAR